LEELLQKGALSKTSIHERRSVNSCAPTVDNGEFVSEQEQSQYMALSQIEPDTLYDDATIPFKPLDDSDCEGSTEERTPRSMATVILEELDLLREPPRDSPLARCFDSPQFSNLSLVAIMLNTGFIWYTVNLTSSARSMELPPFAQAIEMGFLTFYTVEVVLNFMVHKLYFFVNKDWTWNLFDLMIVCGGLFEAASRQLYHRSGGSNITFLRVFRVLIILRMIRVMKIFRSMKELRTMAEVVLGSMGSLMWCAIFMCVILFMSSLFMVQSMTLYRIDNPDCPEAEICGTVREMFGTVRFAMLTLFQSSTGGYDWNDVWQVIKLAGVAPSCFYLAYFVFFEFALFNIVISIFVEKAVKLAKPDPEDVVLERLQHEDEIMEKLRALFDEVDTDGSGTISIEELQKASQCERMMVKFELLGIPLRDVRTFFFTMSAMAGGRNLSRDVFVQAWLKMQGSASGLDMQAIRFEIRRLRGMVVEGPKGLKSEGLSL